MGEGGFNSVTGAVCKARKHVAGREQNRERMMQSELDIILSLFVDVGSWCY